MFHKQERIEEGADDTAQKVNLVEFRLRHRNGDTQYLNINRIDETHKAPI